MGRRAYPTRSLHQDWAALGPAAAQVIGMRLWWMPLWSMLSPQRALQEGWTMVAEKQAALMETQLRVAWLPWLIAMRTMLAPLEAGAQVGPMMTKAFIHPSRRRLRANVVRLRRVQLLH